MSIFSANDPIGFFKPYDPIGFFKNDPIGFLKKNDSINFFQRSNHFQDHFVKNVSTHASSSGAASSKPADKKESGDSSDSKGPIPFSSSPDSKTVPITDVHADTLTIPERTRGPVGGVGGAIIEEPTPKPTPNPTPKTVPAKKEVQVVRI